MKVELKISESMFNKIMADMKDKSVDDYYGTDHPCGWGYKIEEDSASYTTCRENTHGVKQVKGEYIAYIDGQRSTVNSLAWYWDSRSEFHDLEVINIETTNPDMFWYENATQYMVRQGEAYVLTCIPALSAFGLKAIQNDDTMNAIIGDLPSTIVDACYKLDIGPKEALERASGTADVLERRFFYKREHSEFNNSELFM